VPYLLHVTFSSAGTEPPMPFEAGEVMVATLDEGLTAVELPQGLVHAIDRRHPQRTLCGASVDDLYEVAVDFATVPHGRCVCCVKNIEAG
jgi:hypothetical protein